MNDQLMPCGLDWIITQKDTVRNSIRCNNPSGSGPQPCPRVNQKAMNLQQELKKQIYDLVLEQNYKKGYAYYLFIDMLKTKKPTESVIKFFQKKMRKIENIRLKKWKIGALKYD